MGINDIAPEHTAVRVALWRALHVQVDSSPHILNDEIGLRLAGEENWRDRPDMNPDWTRRIRSSIVARARFVEDLVEEQAKLGTTQYVILGAGLDTFVQRQPEIASRLTTFEVDQPGPQKWKENRLLEIGFDPIPEFLKFVPVDFEGGESWWDRLIASGFDPKKPAIVASTGVSMYLTKEANLSTLQQMSKLAPGSCFATTYMLPIDLLEPEDQPTLEFTIKKTREAGTPFISFFTPTEILELAKEAGFSKARYVSIEDIRLRYFTNREDGLIPGSGECFLVAMT
ncbi:class I SAM-dependent methyltransferase [Leptospira adleri]|uniref:S-adenosyl-L-methionine-dependent methyltransferase n=1 Tax=Leptospira adleri TaxID=2023186 RepID=A0A2M9YLU7_9LEPT|nr:class I SAM-dependent methyltransferase [Leptospira adleri]PJZ52509.1 SAM-dependent methyltransferase [Leptospira adleri]PJZ63680.1 SAM-dependent methyltransferase [Leptospira adleri]